MNLPFCGDNEFAGLHAAVRLLLPLLPAIAASSPIVDSRMTPFRDNRLKFYAHHCDVVPSMMGDVIPEPIFDRATYQRDILDPIVHDIAPHDTMSVMDGNFLNARGAIARFDRGSIEIRLLDIQEKSGADIAICGLVMHVARRLTQESWSSCVGQSSMATDRLRKILDDTTCFAEAAQVTDSEYLSHFGINVSSMTAAKLWDHLINDAHRSGSGLDGVAAPLEVIQKHGTLSTRILKSLGRTFSHADLHSVYEDLADCLDRNEVYYP